MQETYSIHLHKRAQKDIKLLKQKPALLNNFREVMKLIRDNPYRYESPFEILRGDLQGCFSVRLNIQHRVIYEVDEETKTIKILRAWSHYE